VIEDAGQPGKEKKERRKQGQWGIEIIGKKQEYRGRNNTEKEKPGAVAGDAWKALFQLSGCRGLPLVFDQQLSHTRQLKAAARAKAHVIGSLLMAAFRTIHRKISPG
jgi:hypothetical protein